MSNKKTIIVGGTIIVLLLIILGILLGIMGKKAKQEYLQQQEKGSGDLADILDEAEMALGEIDESALTKQAKPIDSVRVAPRWLADRRAAEVKDIRDRASNTPKGNAITSQTTGKLTANIGPSDNENGIHSEIRGNIDNEETAKRKTEAALRNETMEWQFFLSQIKSWANPNRSAYEARARAESIRKNAAAIRNESSNIGAGLPDPEAIRRAMFRRADLMDEIANQLSATRGNNTKMRSFIANLDRYENISF